MGVGEGDDRRRGAAAGAHHAPGPGTYINEGDFQRSDVEVGLFQVQLPAVAGREETSMIRTMRLRVWGMTFGMWPVTGDCAVRPEL